MMDWKKTSHVLSEMSNRFGVALSTLDARNGFQVVGSNGLVLHQNLSRRLEKPTPKRIRRWLWEVRYDPVWREPGVLLFVQKEDPTGWVGHVGRIAPPDDERAIVFTEVA